MSDQRWPGEERIAGTGQQKLGSGLPPEEEVEAGPGEEEPAEAEAAPAAERVPAGSAEDGLDTPVPEEGEDSPAEEDEDSPAEEDELPRLRTAGHADGGLSVPDGYGLIEGSSEGSRRAVGIVVGRFNGEVTNRLLENALNELELAGVLPEAITIVPVPGAFELPLGAMALAKSRRFACVVALGCVIRGETPHFEYVASEAASGLQLAGLETGVPISFGVLTLDSADQAETRLGKGAEAVRSALEMADLFGQLRSATSAG
ncbi:MAG TPA: 6,7-dimethyl-8-ribityllumazine synthase [Gaiellaceae bacterium]